MFKFYTGEYKEAIELFIIADSLQSENCKESYLGKDELVKNMDKDMNEFLEEYFDTNCGSFNRYEIFYNVFLCQIMIEDYSAAFDTCT